MKELMFIIFSWLGKYSDEILVFSVSLLFVSLVLSDIYVFMSGMFFLFFSEFLLKYFK